MPALRIRSLHRVTGRDLRHGKFNDFGALFRQAITKALRTVVSSAHSRSMMVEPRCPHPPGTGANIFGSEVVSISCCSRVSRTTPRDWLGESVAKIFPRTRKSGCLICELSAASGSESASCRYSSSVIRRLNLSSHKRGRPSHELFISRRGGDQIPLRGNLRALRDDAELVHSSGRPPQDPGRVAREARSVLGKALRRARLWHLDGQFPRYPDQRGGAHAPKRSLVPSYGWGAAPWRTLGVGDCSVQQQMVPWIWCHTPVNMAHLPSRVWLWSFTQSRMGDLHRVRPEGYAREPRA